MKKSIVFSIFVTLLSAALFLSGCQNNVAGKAALRSALSESDAAVSSARSLTAADASADVHKLLSSKESYSVSVKETPAVINGKSYYVVTVQKGGKQLTPPAAVDAVSGEIFSFHEKDQTLGEFSELTFLSTVGSSETWNGTYRRADKKASVTLSHFDGHSFQFALEADKNGILSKLNGTVSLDSQKKTAAFSDGNGMCLSFRFNGDRLVIAAASRSGDGKYYVGKYLPEKQQAVKSQTAVSSQALLKAK